MVIDYAQIVQPTDARAPREQQVLAPPKPAAHEPSARPSTSPPSGPRPAFGAPAAAGSTDKRPRGRPPKPAAPTNGFAKVESGPEDPAEVAERERILGNKLYANGRLL